MEDKNGLLDEILDSVEREEFDNSNMDNSENAGYNEIEKIAHTAPSSLSEIVKKDSQEKLIDKLHSITGGLTKEASEQNNDTLIKIAGEAISELDDIVEQARQLGKIAAEEFRKNL